MDDKQIREELKKLSPDERALWRSLRHSNTNRGHELELEELWQIFTRRPQFGGIFEPSYSFDEHTWRKAFKHKIRKQLSRAAGVGIATVGRRLMSFNSLTFAQALEVLKDVKAPAQLDVDEFYGKRFGVFRVIPDSAKIIKNGYSVVLKCVYCGAKKSVLCSAIRKNSQTQYCMKCRAGSKTKPKKNSAFTEQGRKVLSKEEPSLMDDLQIVLMSLSWFSIATVTADFSERYVDCMLDVEARKIWTSIHGESL